MDYAKLLDEAVKARNNAYCPYSGFAVGAAVLTVCGKVFTGCNVENAAFNGICAERTALCKAVSEGHTEFKAIAVAGGKKDSGAQAVTPCGSCRQFLTEFCGGDFDIITLSDDGAYKVSKLGFLLPDSFGKSALE